MLRALLNGRAVPGQPRICSPSGRALRTPHAECQYSSMNFSWCGILGGSSELLKSDVLARKVTASFWLKNRGREKENCLGLNDLYTGRGKFSNTLRIRSQDFRTDLTR